MTDAPSGTDEAQAAAPAPVPPAGGAATARTLHAYLPAAALAYGGVRHEWLLLALILVAGAVIRFTGVNWDGGHHLHPDERFLTMVEGAIRPDAVVGGGRGAPVQFEPASVFDIYFDTARSGLNPHNVGFGFFVYGTFPLFAVKLIAEQLGTTGYDKIHLLGRVLSGASDLITVVLIYLIGRRLYGGRVGLVAAALVAFCVMHIQQAHFFVFDSFLVTLVAASFYFTVDIAETARRRSFALAGLFLGLALATKLSMVVFAPIIALAGLVYIWRAGVADRGLSSETVRDLWNDGVIARVAFGGALTLVIAAVTFRVFQPYAFAGPTFFDVRLNPRWLENIAYQAKTQDGTVDLPPSIQWAGTEPLLFPWRHMVLWGMGLPLGLTAWAGFTAAALNVLGRGRWQHLLVVSWSALCFIYFASVLNKTMRYLLPMYPFIILLGAWALVALYLWTKRQRLAALNDLSEPQDGAATARRIWRRLRRYVAEWGPPAALALTALVIISAALWAYAFTRIYTRPVTRVAASHWIYQNVPKGSVLANEHWDDPLPLPIAGYDPAHYRGPQLPMYDPDEPKKIDTLVQMLTQADYINLTSNRLYESIPRIPQRYPMTGEYYARLFSGELGFELVQTFTSYPTLGPWVIVDDRAEEAFTVYDHPKVLIFKKRPDFSPERVRQILSAVPLDNVGNMPPVQVGRPDLIMDSSLRQANLAGGTWSESFSLNGAANALAPLLWFAVLQLLGLLTAPLLWRTLPKLPDRGYGISKAIGLLAVSWLAWLLAGYRLLPWSRLSIALATVALAAVTFFALRRWGSQWLAWLRRHRTLVLTVESVFLATFVLMMVFRAFNPDLWHPARGGEKPMEFSYVNAVIRTTYFPPYDPWFAGGYLNYYYFGYVLVAALAKLTGVMPSIAFNVALPSLYALTAAACFSFAYNLSRLGGPRRLGVRGALGAGVLGFAFVALVGNLDGLSQLLERLAHAGQTGIRSGLPGIAGLWSVVIGVPAVLLGGQPLESFDFWRSSRIIPNNTINEFPFWTFLFSDLHAHLISIPFQVTTLVVLLHFAHRGLPAGTPDLERVPAGESVARWLWRLTGWRRLGEVAAAAWLVGALFVINSWEFPTYLLLTASTFVLAELVAQRGPTLGGLARAGLSAAAVFLLAKPLFGPFWRYYVTFYSSVTPWMQDKSRLDHFLIIHGLLVFGLATFAFVLAGNVWRATGWGRYVAARWRSLAAWDRFGALERVLIADRRFPVTGYVLLLASGATLALALMLRGLFLVAFLAALLAVVVSVAWERRASATLVFASLLAATGLALTIFVEFFALQGDIGRMNTVFKFYLQTWILWALVSAAAISWGAAALTAALRSPEVAEPAPSRFVPVRPLLFDDPVAAGAGDGAAIGWEDPPAAASPVPGTAAAPRPGSAGADTAAPTGGIAWWQWTWAAATVALVVASLAYPLGATPARLADRFNPLPPTLDGMAYMSHAVIEDSHGEVRAHHPQGVTIRAASDYLAIRWLLENVTGSPVIVEASIPEYRWGTRVAKYTGLPAVLGWRWHQVQQRGTYAPQVDRRLRDVQTIYNDPSAARVIPLLNKYGVRYIYVGDLERAYYSAAGIAKFDQMIDSLRPVYQRDGVTIYEVLGATAP